MEVNVQPHASRRPIATLTARVDLRSSKDISTWPHHDVVADRCLIVVVLNRLGVEERGFWWWAIEPLKPFTVDLGGKPLDRKSRCKDAEAP